MKSFGLKVAMFVLGVLFALLPANAQTQRYVFGSSSYTDPSGNVWSPLPAADQSPAGSPSGCAGSLTGLYHQQLFWGSTGTVTIPVPQGSYNVTLYFEEPCVGFTREFALTVNGVVIDPTLNVATEAGGAQLPLTKTATVTGSSVVVTFAPIVGNGGAAAIQITPVAPSITSLTISPASAGINVGQSQQFHCTNQDGVNVDSLVLWTSSNTSVAQMSTATPGLAVGGPSSGTVSITCTKQ